MIKSLFINNIALIDRLSIDFRRGLTVLSGETGSGKSIIVDSLSFVLGERADKSLIKYGADVAEVTALFDLSEDSDLRDKIAEFGYDLSDGQLLLSRKMSVTGRNEVRIQGRPATLAVLRDVAAELVDIFGQGEHLALLDERKQLAVLESFCNDGEGKQRAELRAEIIALDKQIAELGGDDEQRAVTLDFLKYQIDEIAEAKLSVDEEAELLATRKRMMNAEKISAAMATVVSSVSGDGGATNSLSEARDALRAVSSAEPTADELQQRIDSVLLELSDIADCAEGVLDGMEFSEADADRVEERLDKIKSLKRKYGGSVEAVLKHYEQAIVRYDTIANASEILQRLSEERAELVGKLYKLCLAHTAALKKVADKLSGQIMSELVDLGMKNTRFVVEFADSPTADEFNKSPSPATFDKVRFVMSANVGEPLKPLAKVISGGEMSRFMLAVKNITAHAERIPTMIFDEIDTGISGKMAQMVADKLACVSAEKVGGYQCIVITHLPQIVAMADENIVVGKVVEADKTHTVVKVCQSPVERAEEVARLMGGVGQTTIAAADELVEFCADFKAKL